jgi:hypothetical protein
MYMQPLDQQHRLAGICGGTLLSLVTGLHLGGYVHTAITAAVGASVSFGISALLAGIKKKK